MTDKEEGALAELEELYRRLDAECAALGECRACGRCCHFKTFGHRLYASHVEALYLASRSGPPPEPFGPDTCGYQKGRLCLARGGRPLSCRTFHCDASGGFSEAVAEAAVDEIRRISESYCLPWAYRALAEHMDGRGGTPLTQVRSLQ